MVPGRHALTDAPGTGMSWDPQAVYRDRLRQFPLCTGISSGIFVASRARGGIRRTPRRRSRAGGTSGLQWRVSVAFGTSRPKVPRGSATGTSPFWLKAIAEYIAWYPFAAYRVVENDWPP